MRIVFSKSAIKEVRRVPTKTLLSIAEKLGRYAENREANVDVSALQGEEDTYRLRYGTYRVLFTVQGDELMVLAVRPRGGAYQ